MKLPAIRVRNVVALIDGNADIAAAKDCGVGFNIAADDVVDKPFRVRKATPRRSVKD
jgi:hypothetical protein